MANPPKSDVGDIAINTESTNAKKSKHTLWSIMKDACVSIILFVIVALIAQDLNPRSGSIFVRPLSGGSKDNTANTPAAATPSGDGGTTTHKYKTLEDKPFFNEDHSFVDDYYEGHIFSTFQVGFTFARKVHICYLPGLSYYNSQINLWFI